VELCGMVHPECRRKGIFHALYQEALTQCRERGFSEILLNTPVESRSGQGFIQHSGARPHSIEYQMKCTRATPRNHCSPGIRLREARPEDQEHELQVEVNCFGSQLDEAEQFYDSVLAEGTQRCFIIEAEDHAVGRLRVSRSDEQVWIFGFRILPQFQGKGYGKQTILEMIRQYPGQLHLDVLSTNDRAYHLYLSCGFEVFEQQDYYQI
jgi:ribosomal protein S18 acetylase RimI-like enzyme